MRPRFGANFDGRGVCLAVREFDIVLHGNTVVQCRELSFFRARPSTVRPSQPVTINKNLDPHDLGSTGPKTLSIQNIFMKYFDFPETGFAPLAP